jgi:hypothetical protein
MHRAPFLIVTAIGEGGTGLLLLVWPAVPLGLLLGADESAPQTLLVARLAGAALLAIGIACWPPQRNPGCSAQLGLLAALLVYDLTAAGLLAYARLGLGMVGLALWPAVVLHSALAVWCIFCLSAKPLVYPFLTRRP